MYHATRGIFLKQIKYSDTSAVLRVYTEKFGLQGYMVKGLHGKKSKLRPALFQPLSLLELIVTHKDNDSLRHIREARPARIYRSLTTDMLKNAVVLFLDEILIKVLNEEEANPQLFQFIYDFLEWLDDQTALPSLAHLKFALDLTRYLGFYPEGRRSASKPAFDLEGGTFCADPGMFLSGYITGDTCRAFDELLVTRRESLAEIKAHASLRRELLEKILMYYEFHIPTARDFKSHRILHEILK